MEVSLIYRSKVIITAYRDWIPPYSNVLDVGCGNAVVTDELAKHFKCSIVGTDMLDYRKREIVFKIMSNPEELPFANGEFDICMFNDTLHHCRNPEGLLKEALRVSRGVLIFEMEPTVIATVADFIVNMVHNPLMNAPFNIRTVVQWRRCFEMLNLNFEYRKVEKPVAFYPFSNFSFNIRKKTQA